MSENKKQLDMLHGSIWGKVPVFVLPVAATAILEQLFNASDIAVVGNFTGDQRTAAVAAVGANSPIISLILNLFIGIALGANVVIAHAVGRGDKNTVKKAVHTSMTVSVIGGIITAIIGELVAVPLLGVLNVPDDVLPLALLYLRIYLVGMPVILLYNFEAAIFRSVGETKMPLAALAISGALNVVLNLFFVAVLHMTVNGVAIATVISNAVSAAILYYKLRKTTQVIHVELKSLGVDLPSLKHILRIGLPAGVQSAVFSVSNIVVQSAINSLGTVVMAASSAAFNIEVITYDILNAFSQACTTFVGQNYGAGEIKRCKKTLAVCLIEGGITLGTAAVLVLVFGKNLLAIFNNDPEVGETKMPLAALAISGALNVVLNLFFVAVLHMTVNGVAIATVISNAVSAAILYYKLRKTTQVIHVELKSLGVDLPSLKHILRIGLPAGVQSAVFSVSNIVVQSAINSLGTVVMAASSAAFNIEVITYDILNAFSQACTTFVGQNYGAGEIKRCKKTLAVCLIEGGITLGTAAVLVLVFGKNLLAIFNNDPEVIRIGYIRVMFLQISHLLSLLYEVMSGYMRGFGISFAPAVLTMLGVCGTRICWIQWVFPINPTFKTIMIVYPVSLAITAFLIFIALICTHPAQKRLKKQTSQQEQTV